MRLQSHYPDNVVPGYAIGSLYAPYGHMKLEHSFGISDRHLEGFSRSRAEGTAQSLKLGRRTRELYCAVGMSH